jgi:hypothetical protein
VDKRHIQLKLAVVMARNRLHFLPSLFPLIAHLFLVLRLNPADRILLSLEMFPMQLGTISGPD